MAKAKRRGRGEGSIEELPSGKSRVVISAGKDADGSRVKATKTFDRKKDAAAWRADKLAELRGGRIKSGAQASCARPTASRCTPR